jgi:hypothetical protein
VQVVSVSQRREPKEGEMLSEQDKAFGARNDCDDESDSGDIETQETPDQAKSGT